MSLKGELERQVSVRPTVSFCRAQRGRGTYSRTHSKAVVDPKEGTAFLSPTAESLLSELLQIWVESLVHQGHPRRTQSTPI